MNPDIVLYHRTSRKPLCILDTKYKGKGVVLTADYNQVIAYAEAMGCLNSFLVYPKALQYSFNEKPGNIRVKSAIFDLSEDLENAGKAFLETLALNSVADLNHH